MSDPSLLVSAPFPLTIRNFLSTGLVGELASRFGLRVEFISPYPQEEFVTDSGQKYTNHQLRAVQGAWGVPAVEGVTLLDRALMSVHLTGFSLEYPDASLLTIDLSRRPAPQWLVARALTLLAPRASARRRWLRDAYARYRPSRARIRIAFDAVQPSLVLVASPGHYWLDYFVLDEARRRRIPSACVVLSWDNLYSRGPMCRRPDRLLVWSEEMRRQAVEVHQYPREQISVVGPLQFRHYGEPVSVDEVASMRKKVGLGANEPYLAYVCGARTAQYDVEDVGELMAQLRNGPYRDLRVVVRPHPQGSRGAYETLVANGVLLDRSPDLTDSGTPPDAIDVGTIRHMATFLKAARFVISSWGTTALLEACIFDTPTVQLRWMDSIPHRLPEEVRLVRSFQRYIHMRAFDETGARLYCDNPSELNALLAELEANRPEYSRRRAAAVARLTCLPLDAVVDRLSAALQPLISRSAPRSEAVFTESPRPAQK
jgi:hypothetical protein